MEELIDDLETVQYLASKVQSNAVQAIETEDFAEMVAYIEVALEHANTVRNALNGLLRDAKAMRQC